jgi:hypothetical protein
MTKCCCKQSQLLSDNSGGMPGSRAEITALRREFQRRANVHGLFFLFEKRHDGGLSWTLLRV